LAQLQFSKFAQQKRRGDRHLFNGMEKDIGGVEPGLAYFKKPLKNPWLKWLF